MIDIKEVRKEIFKMRDILLQILEAIKALGPAEETTQEVTESVNPAKIAEEPVTVTTTKKRSVTK